MSNPARDVFQATCSDVARMYLDKLLAKDRWEDLYDGNMKLWKVLSFEPGAGSVQR